MKDKQPCIQLLKNTVFSYTRTFPELYVCLLDGYTTTFKIMWVLQKNVFG